MKDEIYGLFKGNGKPDPKTGYALYEKGMAFNASIKLDETIKVNENFYIGKQWEGVQANGLPTPQFNFLKRVVGFIVATITSDNIKVTASPLSSSPRTEELVEPVRVVNEEFDALMERIKLAALIREFTRNSAVDGDGCLYTYWDEDEESGQQNKGAIKTEVIENNRVFFGNPNDRKVDSQPWIMITSRDLVRDVRRRARENGFEDWDSIGPDRDERDIDPAKVAHDDDKVTTMLLMWRSRETKTIWAYEFVRGCSIKEPWDTLIKHYPITWLPWDYVQDCYHGQAMITGLIPNQIFVNKIFALTQVSLMRTAFPKYVYDSTRIKKLDNRVGSAIGVAGGNVTDIIKTIDPAAVSPQISEYIEMAIKKTEESLGATSVALGDTRPDNTSAIIALQRAAATPTEMTKQCLYQSIEDLFRIYLDFMAEYYGKRTVDMPPPEKVIQQYAFVGQTAPSSVPVEFDFGTLSEHPMNIKLDVGASSYYSEIASMQTLDNLLMNGHITVLQYLERIPDGYIPARRALISELQAAQQQAAAQAQAQAGGQSSMLTAPDPYATVPEEGTGLVELGAQMAVPEGGGYGALQRAINETGTTEGLV